MSTRSKPSLLRILSESSNIITSHPLHFLALSALFLFPISLYAAIYPLLSQYPTSLQSYYNHTISTPSTPDGTISHSYLSTAQLVYFLATFIMSLCAASSITHSTILGFKHQPLQLLPSLKSILVSFFPLLATRLVQLVIQWLIMFSLTLVVVLPYMVAVLLGFIINFTGAPSLIFLVLMAALLVGALVFLGVQWRLMNPIVVAESKWGYAPMKRSSILVKRMRDVVLLMMMLFGLPTTILSVWYENSMAAKEGGCSGWVVVVVLVYAGFSTVVSLYCYVSNVVLFVYCKELHENEDDDVGGVEFEIDEKTGVKYARVPLDAA